VRDIQNYVNDTVASAAVDTAGWDKGRVVNEPTPGRFLVELDAGAQIVVGNSSTCYDPTVGEQVDLKKINGILAIDGPSA